MSYLPSSPNIANLADVLAKYPGRGILLYKLLQDIKSSGFPLSKGVHELIVAYTLDLNNYDFCFNAEKKAASENGDREDVVKGQSKTDVGNGNSDEKLKPLLHFIKKLTLTPDQITSKDAQDIFDAGWDEQSFLDSVFLCALVNCVNRVAIGTGIDADASNIRPQS